MIDESHGLYEGEKLLKHGMKIIVRVLKRKTEALVDFDEPRFGFMPGKTRQIHFIAQ